jgi:pyrimidine deaminase RibD-like protein
MEQELIDKVMRMTIDMGKKSTPETGKLTPKVGAAIIKDGKILGYSFRGQHGEGDHAEYTLFEKVLNGRDVSGTTLFTTLEPCTYRKNHKPCTDWTIEKGIKHVFIGMLDPNPIIYNNGCKKLKAAGIEVSYYPRHLREEIKQDNSIFIEQYRANPEFSGKVTFDFTKHKCYTIGNNEFMFETMWSGGSNRCIYAYDDPKTINTISIADGNNEISEIKDASVYEPADRSELINVGQILVLENNNGIWAAIKILEINDKQYGSNRNELSFEFKILPDKSSNFSVCL